MNERIKVIYADDEKYLRETMYTTLKEEGIDMIGEAVNGIELLNLLKKLTPDIVLLDIEMDEMDGSQTLIRLKEKYPNLKIIMFSSYSEEHLKEDFKKKGANAFLSKTSESKLIVNTIRKVHNEPGYSNFTGVSKSIFSSREIEFIPLFLSGLTSKAIGDRLNVTEKAVEAIRSNLYKKTNSKNAAELSKHLTKLGLDYIGKPQ